MSHNPHGTQPPKRWPRCACPPPGHQHGCDNRYRSRAYSCRCHPCTVAHRRRNKAIALADYPNRMIPSIGTARRLQGLAVIGWTARELAPHIGASFSVIERWRVPTQRTVETRTADRVAALVDKLWDVPPTGRQCGITLVRRNAACYGWVPLLAWDDIDDPDDTPQGLRLTPADRVTRLDQAAVDLLVAGVRVDDATRAEIGAAIVHLTALGLSTQDIEARLAVPISSRWVQRARARARLEVAA